MPRVSLSDFEVLSRLLRRLERLDSDIGKMRKTLSVDEGQMQSVNNDVRNAICRVLAIIKPTEHSEQEGR